MYNIYISSFLVHNSYRFLTVPIYCHNIFSHNNHRQDDLDRQGHLDLAVWTDLTDVDVGSGRGAVEGAGDGGASLQG